MLPLPPNAITQVEEYLLALQQSICASLESFEHNKRFLRDQWTRSEGGGGVSCVLEGGDVFEKAGVNFSHVSGLALPPSATIKRPQLAGCAFTALGVSLVIHPDNPYIPTTHANVRFFLAEQPNQPAIWWFGGGFDLTPYYGVIADCEHWHRTAKHACDPFGDDLYPRFKAWCDDYFYIKHRQEARGIGGLFFDDFCEQNFEYSFAFMRSIGDHFIPAYTPIVDARQHTTFGEREKAFQRYRRGRYVEYNLVYDRGTLFGLQSNGRTESILMSLPPQVDWQYNWHPEPGTPEAELYQTFLPIRAWI